MKFAVRKIHKYLSFFISVQLLLWTVSGIYFAFNKIEQIRGEQYRDQENIFVDLAEFNFPLPASAATKFFNRNGETIMIVSTGVGTRYLDKKGADVSMLTDDEAIQIVKANTNLMPKSAEIIDEEKAGSEYRGRALPIYKVITDNDKGHEINVYINVYSGEVLAIRSAAWRIWDLMWGFHIMDWQERDNIDNILLKVFSILALISSITGVLLFFRVDNK